MIGDPAQPVTCTPTKMCRESLISGELSPYAREDLKDNRPSNAKMIVIEGNIGVGKTTLARSLSNQLKYRAFLEPALENPFLELFYADPHKYALKLQFWIFRQRYDTYVKAVRHMRATGGGVILDRSVFSDYVFACVGRNQGFITKEGFAEYERLRELALKSVPKPHFVIYLNASPETCTERLTKRGRECESAIPLDYLRNLDLEYNSLLKNTMFENSTILNINWTEFGTADDILQKMAQQSPHVAWDNEEFQNVFNEENTISRSFNEAIKDRDF